MSLRYRNLNPYELHKTLVNEYFLKKPGDTNLLKRDTTKDKTDRDVIEENHRFLWEADNEATTWGEKLAKKYFDKLFKEYTISDLSRYKENKIALRWRIEKEVIAGKGQFICGNKICTETQTLRTWEVNFGYLEHGEKKNTLVKLRLCPSCSEKLNYHTAKREIKRLKKKKHQSRSKSRSSSSVISSSSDVPERESTAASTSGEKEKEPQGEDVHHEMLEKSCWASNATVEVEERNREDEFDEYLEDLLL